MRSGGTGPPIVVGTGVSPGVAVGAGGPLVAGTPVALTVGDAAGAVGDPVGDRVGVPGGSALGVAPPDGVAPGGDGDAGAGVEPWPSVGRGVAERGVPSAWPTPGSVPLDAAVVPAGRRIAATPTAPAESTITDSIAAPATAKVRLGRVRARRPRRKGASIQCVLAAATTTDAAASTIRPGSAMGVVATAIGSTRIGQCHRYSE